MQARGTVHRFGDHVDTDVIIPARYLNTSEPAELARHCMEDADPAFVGKVRAGDIIVGGRNFGCGSSREHAPLAIKAAGIACVVAASFARIFFRNALNIGLPLVECPEAANDAKSGDVLEVDFDLGEVTNVTQGKVYTVPSFPPFMQQLIAAGGLVNYTRAQLSGEEQP